MDGGGTEQYASENIVAKLGDFGLSAVLCGPYQVLFILSFKEKEKKKKKKKKREKKKEMRNNLLSCLASCTRKYGTHQPKVGRS